MRPVIVLKWTGHHTSSDHQPLNTISGSDKLSF
jgi:hypothetical protein